MKNDQVAKFDVQASGLFLPIDSHFGQIVRYGLQICFASIYSNFDIQRACLITLHSNFEIFQKGHPAVAFMIDRRIFER